MARHLITVVHYRAYTVGLGNTWTACGKISNPRRTRLRHTAVDAHVTCPACKALTQGECEPIIDGPDDYDYETPRDDVWFDESCANPHCEAPAGPGGWCAECANLEV